MRNNGGVSDSVVEVYVDDDDDDIFWWCEKMEDFQHL